MARIEAKIRRLEEEVLEKDKQIEKWRCRWDEKNRELESYNRELVALKELYKERARELRAVMEKLEEVSITDDLTQIFNHGSGSTAGRRRIGIWRVIIENSWRLKSCIRKGPVS
jgi:uncharacterized protein YPO0396